MEPEIRLELAVAFSLLRGVAMPKFAKTAMNYDCMCLWRMSWVLPGVVTADSFWGLVSVQNTKFAHALASLCIVLGLGGGLRFQSALESFLTCAIYRTSVHGHVEIYYRLCCQSKMVQVCSPCNPLSLSLGRKAAPRLCSASCTASARATGHEFWVSH